MKPRIPPWISSKIIPYLSLSFTPAFQFQYVGSCKLLGNFLVDEETSTFVRQFIDDKPYYYHIDDNRGYPSHLYKIYVSIFILD